MKKVLQWTLGIHLIMGGFFPSLVSGLAYKELDQIKTFIADARDSIDNLEKAVKLFLPWM